MMTIFQPFVNTLDNMRDSWEHAAEAVMPRTDLRDTGDSYVLEADLPGFRKEEIQLNIEGDVLTLTAEHVEKCDANQADKGTFLQRQRSACSYQQKMDISNVDVEHMQAAYENGVLTLTMPKKQPVVPAARQIPIQ
ncbi:MAG: Hsp20/alpha crystallin family protein [Ruminococcus sp.]